MLNKTIEIQAGVYLVSFLFVWVVAYYHGKERGIKEGRKGEQSGQS